MNYDGIVTLVNLTWKTYIYQNILLAISIALDDHTTYQILIMNSRYFIVGIWIGRAHV